MIKTAIVDDNPSMRIALEKIISGAEEFELTGSYEDMQEAIVLIPLMKPDVVIIDINLGNNGSGIDCIRKIKPDHPEILFMICTVFDDDEKIFEALCAGANGYMLKRTSPAELIRALKEMYEGGAPMSGLIAKKVVSVFQVNDSGGWGWNPLHAKKCKTSAQMFETYLPRQTSNDCDRLSRRWLDNQENQRMHSLFASAADARGKDAHAS